MIKYIKQSQNSFINISSEIVKTKFVFCWNRWKFLCLLMLKSLEFCSVVYWQLSIDTFIWIINSLWRKFLLPDYHNQSPNHIFTLIVRLLPRFCKALCVRNNFPLQNILTKKRIICTNYLLSFAGFHFFVRDSVHGMTRRHHLQPALLAWPRWRWLTIWLLD